MAELRSAKDTLHRWYALTDASVESLNRGHDRRAKSYAEELEQLTPRYMGSENYGSSVGRTPLKTGFRGNWNCGNAIQSYNIVFGRLALKSGDVETAKKYLLAAGHSPGSPQMDSGGPNMSLAKALLAKGEKAVVLDYIELCRRFWECDGHCHDNPGQLNRWKADIKANRVPDFGLNLDR